MIDVVTLGIDLGKSSCSIAGLDAEGRVVLRRRISRDSLEPLLRKLTRARFELTDSSGIPKEAAI